MENTASNFATWFYSGNYNHNSVGRSGMAIGTQMEEYIQKKKTRNDILLNKVKYENKGFSLIYNGMTTGAEDSLFVSSLEISGCSMACKPDLILESDEGEVIIIENKYTGHVVGLPSDGWMNNRLQLWCYSKIDKFVERDVSLVLQFWNYNHCKIPAILEKSKWSRHELEDFSELFASYKQECESGSRRRLYKPLSDFKPRRGIW